MALQEFTEAVNQAADQLFITTEEAKAAIERCRNEHQGNNAVSVIDEAANTFYENFVKMPDDVRGKVSCHMLRNIFDHVVKPAIETVRNLDRAAR